MKFKYFNQFDKVTQFRLQNAFMVAISLSLIEPVLIFLKGNYMVPWVIGMFGVGATLAVKTNNYFVHTFSMEQLYKLSVFTHLLLILSTSLFFYDKEVMVWVDSLITLWDITVFSAYSIVLNNYLTDNYPGSMKDFQIVRNSTWANGAILGSVFMMGMNFLFPLDYGVIVFIIYTIIFSAWLLYNYNFYNNIIIKGKIK